MLISGVMHAALNQYPVEVGKLKLTKNRRKLKTNKKTIQNNLLLKSKAASYILQKYA